MLLGQLLHKQAVKLGVAKDAPKGLDTALPLGGRIGGLVTIQNFPFLIAEEQGGLVTLQASTATIKAISSYTFGGNKTYIYHLNTEQPSYLQCTLEEGHQMEVSYFHEVNRSFFTESGDVLNFLTPGGLGSPEFNCPMTDPPTVFQSCYNDEDTEFFNCQQKTIYDAMGQTGSIAEVTFAYYSRPLKDNTLAEFMFIGLYDPQDDTSTTLPPVWVSYCLGMTLNPTTIQII